MLLRKNAFALLAAIVVVYALALASVPPREALGRLQPDDALYYFEIARNAARGLGTTFDEIHLTNGFHPLWLVALVPVYAVFGADELVGFHAALVLQALLLVPLLALLGALGRRWGWNQIGLFAALVVLTNPLFMNKWVNGMESSLFAVLLLLTLLSLVRWLEARGRSRAPGAELLLGGAAGMTMLARLDSVVFVVVLSLHPLLQSRRSPPGEPARPFGERLGAALRIGGAASLVVAPYLAANLLVFGRLVPISGALKLAGAGDGLDALAGRAASLLWPVSRVLALPPAWLAAVALPLAALLVAGALPRWRPRLIEAARSVPTKPGLGVFLAYCIAYYAFSSLFMPVACRNGWYHIPFYLAAALVVGSGASAAFADTARRRPGLCFAVACAVLILSLSANTLLRFGAPNELYAVRFDGARWIEAHLEEDALLASFDAGTIGYFSDRRVVNLDGLVNDFEYQEFLRTGTVAEYLRREGVEYLAQYVSEEPGRRAAWLASLEGLLEAPVYSRAFVSRGRSFRFSIWRLSDSGASSRPPD